ncbi:MAG TPA: hypothetical protein VEH09_09795 [Thermodesulfobacteriota bacterium]|nr:hypothetical protein [Thermodesulfobacteriota bacterium]
MINLEGRTKESPEEVIHRLKKYFGKGGQGLELTEENPSCLNFTGGGGYVTATVCAEKGRTRITLVAKEWEHQAKEFLAGLS